MARTWGSSGVGAYEDAIAPEEDGGATGIDEREQGFGMSGEAFDESFLLSHIRKEEGVGGLGAQARFVELGMGFAGELEREDLADEIAGTAAFEADPARGGVVAGDEAPKAIFVQHRDRHRRSGSHVAHVFDGERETRCGGRNG